jgi:uncharacterized protein with PQ loop repeat
MGKYEILASVAGALNIISFGSLVQNVYWTKNTESLTWTWIFVNLCAQIIFCVYGILNQAYGIYIPTILFILGLLFILFRKIVHIFEKGQKETKA